MVKHMGRKKVNWTFIITILVILYIVSAFSAFIINGGSLETNKIAVIKIYGPITLNSQTGILPTKTLKSQTILDDLNKIKKDKSIKGLIVEINSPGGTTVASEEIANKIKDLNITTYAVIREVGASGGYWIATATDKIYASEMSITGSIGVISSYLEFNELFNKYGINYQRLVSGEFKDMGSPYKDMTEQEKEIFQKKISKVHDYFIEEVATNRDMEIDEVKKVATGEFYLGTEAKELNLIDEFGDKDKAIEDLKKELNLKDPKIVEYTHKQGFLDLFTKMSTYIGYGFGEALIKKENNFNIQV